MADILQLPCEILHRIFWYADQRSRKNLRLTSQLFAGVGRTWVFRSVKLSPLKAGRRKFRKILNDPALAASVSSVYLDTITPADLYYPDSPPDQLSDNYDYDSGEEDNGDDLSHIDVIEADPDDKHLPRPFWRLVSRLRELPRLQSITLGFFYECSGEETPWSLDVSQSIAFRSVVMHNVMAALASLPRLPLKLSLRELQNINPTDVKTVANVTKVLGGLRSLRLNIANECDEDNPENEQEKDAIHPFFSTLPSFWFQPMASNLEHLTLYSNVYFGFYPRLDLRGVHFPRLKTLSFGKYTFAHDSQLEWILSHGDTLKELYLDNCPILFEVAIEDNVETLLDPSHFKPHPGPGNKMHAAYETRWCDYLRGFKDGLLQLQHFRLGNCQQWFSTGETPFRLEPTMKIGFHRSYMVFCHRWRRPYSDCIEYEIESESGSEYEGGGPLSPSEEDITALKELMDRLGQQAQLDNNGRAC